MSKEDMIIGTTGLQPAQTKDHIEAVPCTPRGAATGRPIMIGRNKFQE